MGWKPGELAQRLQYDEWLRNTEMKEDMAMMRIRAFQEEMEDNIVWLENVSR